MCGIAGIVSLEGFDPRGLVAMTHLIRYRGPNGFGFAYSRPGDRAQLEIIQQEDRLPSESRPVIGLGNRRLAILDVSPAGNQPMEIDDGDYCITFNGEVYNYKEIRETLKGLGHRFRTGTDTEVILHGYKEWGEHCLNRFNGMWSFALWDRSRQRLFCARDRFGVKPFYYAIVDGAFYFASEIKQILLGSNLPRGANPRCVHDFLEWGLLDHSAETFFQLIYQLPGGHCLTLDLSSPLAPVISRYWELRIEPKDEISVESATEEFRARFENAVKLRLRSDVPVGISLSGGLDSSSVACQARELSPQTEFHAFSACFDDKSIDEREYISAIVAAIAGVSHSTFPQAKSFWSSVQSIVYHMDEPPMSTSIFPQWCVMEDAQRNGVPVVLGGQGGDEVLCGYHKYRYFYLWHLLSAGDPRFLRETLLWARNGTRFHWSADSVSRYLPNAFRRQYSLVARLCTPQFRHEFSETQSGLGIGRSIAERQKTDLNYSSIPILLHHEDRTSMAHSVESRLPFLDYELVEFAVNCPASLKLRDGWSKWILRNALADTLPEKIRLRKSKLGFDAPDAEWLHLGLQNGQRTLWETPRLRMERFLNAPSLTMECRRFLRRDPGALPSGLIFRAIAVELWAQVHGVS